MKYLLTLFLLIALSAFPARCALTFSASGDRVDYAANNFNIHDGTHSAGTIAGWIYLTDDTARQGFFGHIGDGSGTGSYACDWRADLAGDEVQCYRQRGSGYLSANAQAGNFAAYALNKWVFVAFRWDTNGAATDQQVYIGDLSTAPAEPSAYATQSAGSGTVGSFSAAYRVGNNVTNTARVMKGRVATVYVYASALTAAQITAQWKICRPVQSSPRLYAQIGWGGSTLVPDYSGNLNAGTITGSLALADHLPCSIWGL